MIGACVLLALIRSREIEHLFVYKATERYGRVNIAGSFNGWNRDADAMTVSADGLTWTRQVPLSPGTYTYKFVLDGTTWVTDPTAAKNVDDGSGNKNSELLVLPIGYEKPAKKGDGVITASVLRHLMGEPFLNYDRGKLMLTLQTRANDIASVKIAVDGRGSFAMSETGGDDVYTQYVAQVPWDRKHDFRYRFLLDDGSGTMVFGPNGLLPRSAPTAAADAYTVRAAEFKPFEVPSWVEHSVIYQIFPDRFANGDKSNDPPNVAAWDAQPRYSNFFGGDVAGVEQHLSYLKALGISTVYFNPVFKSPSNHRYETADYLQIDPRFGTNAEFIQLTHDLKRAGIRTVLDGVFNHTATSFFPFADVVKNGASSKYTDWYTFKSFPVRVGQNPNYLAWFNYPSMPKLNYTDADVRKYILGVPEFWQTSADVAGWRLDAANEVSPDFWREFRTKVKSLDKDAWILGEVWGDGTPWLQGDEWDSVMNYQFRKAVLDFVSKSGNGKPTGLVRELMRVYASYAPQVSRNMMNLIGSHDTPRILNLCGGDASLAELAALIQFTWVGTPSIYYGDEIGMNGGADPDNRRGMTWEAATPDNGVLNFYKLLIRTRNQNLPLQSGDPVPIVADDDKQVAAFARVLGDQADVVALNRSGETESIDLNLSTVAGLPKTVLTVDFTDALSGRVYKPDASTLHLRLAPRSAAVLIPRLGSSIHPRHDLRALSGAALATSKESAQKEPK